MRVLEFTLQPQHFPDQEHLLNALQQLTPGLMGCISTPSSVDTYKPVAAIKDATVQLLYTLQQRMPEQVNLLLHDALLRAPEKAALRNMLIDAVDKLSAEQSSDKQAAWIHFIALLSYSPAATQRLLALQLLDPMLDHFLAVRLQQFRNSVCRPDLNEQVLHQLL
jgi:hypothetical protein